ncbi:hypothetical protein, partial [Gordonia hongkongensis]|uniref:hypothetical protein n=1 Tax=Gordonia hongkongensis TaxID=1701090 RepID=UPI003EBA4C98
MSRRSMTKARLAKAVASLAAASAILPVLTGCGDSDAEAHHSHEIQIDDVSVSAMSPQARISDLAEANAVAHVESMSPGDRLSIYAFGKSLTSACVPIDITFPEENSEGQDQLRNDLVGTLPSLLSQYVSCVRDPSVGGSSDSGSPIFGAIHEAMESSGGASVTAIRLITDGCSFGEGVDTCVRDMTDVDFAQNLVERMPEAMKPRLNGITLTVVGLGHGTEMSGSQ